MQLADLNYNSMAEKSSIILLTTTFETASTLLQVHNTTKSFAYTGFMDPSTSTTNKSIMMRQK